MPFPFIMSDAGRSESRRAKQGNDCAVRAVALACGLPYDQSYDMLAAEGRDCGRGFHFREYIDSLNDGDHAINGYRLTWIPFPAVRGQRRMNPELFARDYAKGRYICRTAKHVYAVIDGAVYDTFRERGDRCVYGAWHVSES